MKKNRAIFTAIGFFGIAAAAFVFLVVYPLFQGIQRDYEEAIDKKRALVQLEEDRKRAREFTNTLAQHEADFSRLTSLFLDVASPIAFFRFLDNLSAEFGLTLEKNPGTPVQHDEDPWPSLDVRIQGTGDFTGAQAFLQKVEHGPYLLEVRNLSFTSSREQTTFTALLKVYTK